MVFMGSPDFALPTLSYLAKLFHVVGVITQPDRPAGRGRQVQPPPVKSLAIELDLPVLQPPSLKDPAVVEQLTEMDPDVIVVAAFGQLLKSNILSLPPFGCVNVHASLLPRWRGAAPVHAAVLHDTVTGVTIMLMDQGLDTGPILSQRSVPIPGTMNTGELSERLAHLGAELLVETLPKYITGEIKPRPQDDDQATYAPRLTTADGLLDFNQPAVNLARQVRAFHPWPGTYQFFNGIRLKVFKAHASAFQDAVPGKRYLHEGKPAWGTVEGLIVLDEVQVAGKARLPGDEFIKGTRAWMESKED